MIKITGSDEQIAELFSALANAQSKFEGAHKGTSGHGYKYADLAAVWDSIREPLSENNVFVSQFQDALDITDDEVGICTMIAGHGAAIYYPPTVIPLPPENRRMNSSQRVGAALMYARRYALESVFCLSRVDDTDVQTIQTTAREISEQYNVPLPKAVALLKQSRETGKPVSRILSEEVGKEDKKEEVESTEGDQTE